MRKQKLELTPPSLFETLWSMIIISMILVSFYKKMVDTNHIQDIQNFVEASFDKYHDQVYFFARSRSRTYAKDMVQETFKKFQEELIKKREMDFSEDEAVLRYLIATARNLTINKLKSVKRFVQFEDGWDNGMLDDPCLAIDQLQEITTMLHLVNDKEATMLKMYSIGYSYKEIAEEMDMTLSAVKKAFYRCRKKLKPFKSG